MSVFAMIETARGLAAVHEICAVPGLDRDLRRPGGPGHLHGIPARRRLDAPRGACGDGRRSTLPPTRPGWSPESTPGQGSSERPWPTWVSR